MNLPEGSSYGQGAEAVGAYIFKNFRKLPPELLELLARKHMRPADGTSLTFSVSYPMFQF
jgi:hypothetical protein